MNTQCRSTRALFITTMAWAWIIAAPIRAHESEHKITAPGFRPPTEAASEFVQGVENSKIAVFPSIVRTVKPAEDTVNQAYSSVALDQAVDFLKEHKLGSAAIVDTALEIGEVSKGPQYAVFNETMAAIGKQLDGYEGDAEYALVIDIINVNGKAWGIQCYILNRSGENVFSFLLNSHHQALVEADIRMKDESVQSKEQFISASIELALESLLTQVVIEQGIATYKPDPDHFGRYASEEEDPAENYIELKPNGSFSIKDDGHSAEGRYAVVAGNTLIIVMPGQAGMPVGKLENGKLITSDGRTATRTALDSTP